MPAPSDHYEALVEQEDTLVRRINICSDMIETVLQSLYEKDGPVHLQTVRDIVSAMHDVQVKLERELLVLRAEKRLAARPTDRKPSDFR
jgi:TPP-dependent 2-oxoacid decarboxylase